MAEKEWNKPKGTYPNRLKELREYMELPATFFAQLLKVSPTLICYYEQGQRELPPIHMRRLANFFKLPIRELYVTEDGKLPKKPRKPGERRFCTECRSFYTTETCPVCKPAK
jgi:transcriptional regulator with XRE-family HTH domain